MMNNDEDGTDSPYMAADALLSLQNIVKHEKTCCITEFNRLYAANKDILRKCHTVAAQIMRECLDEIQWENVANNLKATFETHIQLYECVFSKLSENIRSRLIEESKKTPKIANTCVERAGERFLRYKTIVLMKHWLWLIEQASIILGEFEEDEIRTDDGRQKFHNFVLGIWVLELGDTTCDLDSVFVIADGIQCGINKILNLLNEL